MIYWVKKYEHLGKTSRVSVKVKRGTRKARQIFDFEARLVYPKGGNFCHPNP